MYKNLKYEMDKSGHSIRQLAEILNISYYSARRMLMGQRNIKYSEVLLLSGIYMQPVDYLFR